MEISLENLHVDIGAWRVNQPPPPQKRSNPSLVQQLLYMLFVQN